MRPIVRNGIIAFLTGFVIGCVVLLLIMSSRIVDAFTPVLMPLIIIRPLFSLIEPALDWICGFFKPDLCRGLGFDGGPLVWVEYVWFFIVMGVYYGLIVEIIYWIMQWVLSRRKLS